MHEVPSVPTFGLSSIYPLAVLDLLLYPSFSFHAHLPSILTDRCSYNMIAVIIMFVEDMMVIGYSGTAVRDSTLKTLGLDQAQVLVCEAGFVLHKVSP